MIAIKAYCTEHFYTSKCGEKLDKNDAIGIFASIECNRPQIKEENLKYVACGETQEEAREALRCYLLYSDLEGKITREEIEQFEVPEVNDQKKESTLN